MKPPPAPLLDTYRALIDHLCNCRDGVACEERRRLDQAWRKQRSQHQPRRRTS